MYEDYDTNRREVLECLNDWISNGYGDECFWEVWPECPTEGILTPNKVMAFIRQQHEEIERLKYYYNARGC